MDSILLLTRPGFEADCAAEWNQRCSALGLAGYAKAKKDTGWLEWVVLQGNSHELPDEWVFARRQMRVISPFTLEETDRVKQLLPLLPEGRQWKSTELLHADTNEGRSLTKFCRGFTPHWQRALKKQGKLKADASGKLGVFFQDSCHGFIGEIIGKDKPLPRLRLSHEAPSRSAMKLEEAFLFFFDDTTRAKHLRPGMTAVDLGAAPGGWSWYLASRGLKVTGIDHGKMQLALLANYPVTQISADAYTWQPPRPVNWVVCDVVEKPARTTALMLKWLQQGWAKAAVFNLKLPMKQRFKTLLPLLEKLEDGLAGQVQYRLAAHHLYHDREEVTVLVVPTND